ncbi:hypothetical protein Mgra_00002861 [Meloidogyne graminicola]|uniref:Uncharacterized protein n=1 Tax=Meloidogyne graminicola TaxID=189291 RepID=A0A8S9ZWT6_9BILA|nr:hypothetical protein Mgra_00002861 [Meloidogyne graminicola]
MLITKRILVLFCFFFLSSIINSSNSEDVQVGFGNHTLKDGKVTLAIGTRIANENDFKDNKGHLPACVASIKGNQITLLYNEKSEEGCTVDLLTNVTYIELDANLNFCVKIEGKAAKRENFDNYKILPFAYSLTNKELNKIWDENATCSERSSCLKNKEIKANCMPWTAMKITWELNTTHLSVCLTLLGTNEYVFENSTIKVNNSSTSVKYHVSIHKNKDGGTISQYNYKAQTSSNSVFSDMKFKCIDKSALKPKTWEIDGGTYNGQQMFTFNLLPRTKINSSKKFIESPNQCENITIVLSSEYKLLFVDKATLTKDKSLNTSSTTLSTTTTTTTTTTTSSLSTTSTTTSTTTKPTTTTTSTTTKPINHLNHLKHQRLYYQKRIFLQIQRKVNFQLH